MLNIGIVCDQFGNLQRGGAEVQVENTVIALQRTGMVNVEYITHETTDVSKFDVVHFFKSIFEYTPVALALKEKGIPYVVSTIIFPKCFFWEACVYDLTRFLPNRMKSLFSVSRRVQLWDNASLLFPNTNEEAKFVLRVSKNAIVKVIPNGLDLTEMSEISDELFLEQFPFLKRVDFVLNVARIEPRKNQKLLVQACQELNIPVVIIGKIGDSQYYNDVVNLNYNKCYILGPIYNRELLFSAYMACSVFCLPSTLETPGIAAMEAAYYNTPIVVTKNGGADYYFKDSVYYVDGKHKDDIKLGILEMKNKKVKTRELIAEYSWNNIANMYIEFYKKIRRK